ncbi:MAG TPA: outer membrane beta-barrel domain-containing protein [Pseudobdellovibrionaceae bacterium]|nr:outer membrane beta-barrel domain-containing protein [Pseudobdellovibrionaceae bacterium]
MVSSPMFGVFVNHSLRAIAAISLLTAAMGISTLALAQASSADKKAPAAPAGGGDKVDVTDLEQKYWAAKDTDFSVVQNRMFSKANRFAVSALYGNLLNDSWSDGPSMSGSLNYYFSERWGLEAQLMNVNTRNNKALENLQAQSGTANHGKVRSYQGLSVNWVPFYAKMSVLNSNIIYFDMAISPGFGVTTYDQQTESGNRAKTAPTVALDLTQTFFLNKHFALRLDYRNRWYQEEIIRYRSPFSSVSNDTTNASFLMFGATLFW